METVLHEKSCARDPHARVEEGASAQAESGRSALPHKDARFISVSEFDRPTAVIKVNRLYRHGISADELSDITRGYWKTAKRKVRLCDIVLSVYRGEVKEVYDVDQWVDGHELKMATNINGYRPGSYGFNGHVAPKHIRDKFIGRSVGKLYKKGDQNPVRAFNVI